MIELQRCTDKDQWDEYVLERAGHPLQLWSWGQLKAAHGWVVERVFAYNDTTIIGAAQVLIRSLPSPFRAFAYVPRGPIFSDEYTVNPDDNEAVEYRDEFLQALGWLVKREYHAVALSIEPNVFAFDKPDKWVRSMNQVLPAETILLDLEKTESQLLAEMAKKTRQYIRKSASEVVIRPVKNSEALEACLQIYHATAKRAGFNLHKDQYYRDVYMQMQDHSPIFAAYVDNEPVAFLWLAISADTAYELYGGVTELGQQLRANYALKWQAIRKVKEWGLRQYDFGGMVAGGVSTFKHGWAPDVTLFAGTFDLPLSPLYLMWSKGLPFAKRVMHRVRRGK